jgi:two-component sensor histidine kinase
VTNNLVAVLGLMSFEKNHARSDPQSIMAAMTRLDQHIRGLLQVHRMLSRSSWAPVPVHELAGQIIHAALQAVPWRQAAVVTVKPGAEKVSPRQAGALAMVINELATNSVKYGNPAGGAVTIGFEAESDPEGMTLRYRDNGPGYPPEVLAQERSNIGLKLIHELVKGTLGGQVTIANDHGAVTTLRIRLEEETRT